MWGSIINALSFTAAQNANKIGPLGPIAAITALYSPLLVVAEAVRNKQMISLLEGIGVILGLYGATLMVVPKLYQKYCLVCFKFED